MAVRAKFQVWGVDPEKGEVTLSAVVSNDPESENAQFENGQKFYVDFTPVN